MSRPKKVELTLKERLKKIRDAGLTPPPEAVKPATDLAPMPERIRQILQLVRRPAQNPYDMLYLVMYDIEDDRVPHGYCQISPQQGLYSHSEIGVHVTL